MRFPKAHIKIPHPAAEIYLDCFLLLWRLACRLELGYPHLKADGNLHLEVAFWLAQATKIIFAHVWLISTKRSARGFICALDIFLIRPQVVTQAFHRHLQLLLTKKVASQPSQHDLQNISKNTNQQYKEQYQQDKQLLSMSARFWHQFEECWMYWPAMICCERAITITKTRNT